MTATSSSLTNLGITMKQAPFHRMHPQTQRILDAASPQERPTSRLQEELVSLRILQDGKDTNALRSLQKITEPKPLPGDPPKVPETLEAFWHRVYANLTADPDEHRPERIMVAHRIVRLWAVTKGMMAAEQTLIAGLESKTSMEEIALDDRWIKPEAPKPASCNDASWRPDTTLLQIFYAAQKAHPMYCFAEPRFNLAGQYWEEFPVGGLPLVPPAVPRLLEADLARHNQDYTPDKDEILQLYCLAIEAATEILNLRVGSIDMPDMGVNGLRHLSDPQHVRDLFPTRSEIILWETMLLDEILHLLVTETNTTVRAHLKKKYGYTTWETTCLIKAAKSMAHNHAGTDTEEERSLMILRLDDVAKRARGGLDLRAELGALKVIAIIRGLAKVEADSSLQDLIKTVQKFSGSSAPDNYITHDGPVTDEEFRATLPASPSE